MIKGYRNQNIDTCYVGKGSTILKEFLLPAINNAINYDRITSFYTIDSLLAISQGLQNLYKANGKMRLIIGVHSIPDELYEATLSQDVLKNEILKINNEIYKGILSLKTSLEKDLLATLAWMIYDKLLEVKAVAIRDGIFHPKTLILTDGNDDSIVAVGSPNETSKGLGDNIEQIMIAKSWENQDAVLKNKEYFNLLWDNKIDYAYVTDITDETLSMVRKGIGEDFFYAFKNRKSNNNVIDLSSKMISNYFVSGDIPSLFVHQEHAVVEALSRWPVRALFADEVGLGKTFELASTMLFLMKYCGVNRVLILTPKSVMQQWQDELFEHFKINAYIYDSGEKCYLDANKEIVYFNYRNPLGKNSPNVIIMSAQYARGNKNATSILESEDAVLPDLIIVDEAHAARISKQIDGHNKKTRLYSVLENISRKIPHMLLATATPMQKESSEYHSLLKLIGLPDTFNSAKRFNTSLCAISSNELPDLTCCYTVGIQMIDIVKTMKPDMSAFSREENLMIFNLENVVRNNNKALIGEFVANNWRNIKELFIRLHPARLLTVRNTRNSLGKIGYVFPKRNLIEVSIKDSMKIQAFYENVEEYLTNACFSVEKLLFNDKNKTLGFVKVSYQQRIASSLYSCKLSLKRRMEKIGLLRKSVDSKIKDLSHLKDSLQINYLIDEMDFEEYLGNDYDDECEIDLSKINLKSLIRALNIEYAELNSLVSQADKLLEINKDPKINKAIELVSKCCDDGKEVLVFSRYTDTLEALILQYSMTELCYPYGIYSGKQSCIKDNGKVTQCTKDELKIALNKKRIRVVFCSDAASEGLNLQAASVLINVDVPWTPSRLEQRIGRIARLGQTAKEVFIYNIWYPYSVEARMYSRIQKRLNNALVAIGDFPDIVAENIKNMVLKNEDNSQTGIKELNDLRNSMQIDALKKLWNNSCSKLSYSYLMRKKMIDIVRKDFECTNKSIDSKTYSFAMPDNTIVELSEHEGQENTICLSSVPFKYKKYETPLDCEYLNNIPVCFCTNIDGKKTLLKNYAAFAHELGEKIQKNDYLLSYPSTLPNCNNLSTEYAVDCKLLNKPNFWIEEQT